MALIDNINDGFKQLATLIKGKVNKTDVIAVAQGGTGAKDAETARGNLGLGTASTRNVGLAVNNIPEMVANSGIGASGLSGVLIGATPDTTAIENVKGGFFRYSDSSTQRPAKMGIYDNYGFVFLRQAAKYGAALWLPYHFQSNKQICMRTFGNTNYVDYYFYTDQNMPSEDVTVKSLKSGASSYKKGWRKLTATLPNQAGEITEAHGVTTVEAVQAKVTNSDGIIIYNNDIDPANQFYVRVNGTNLVLGVTDNSTKVFGKTVTIYVGEEL